MLGLLSITPTEQLLIAPDIRRTHLIPAEVRVPTFAEQANADSIHLGIVQAISLFNSSAFNELTTLLKTSSVSPSFPT